MASKPQPAAPAPSPAPAATPSSAAAHSTNTMDATPTSPASHLHTYHCICNQLVLASTHTLSSLPRRQAPGLDNAMILPLPPLPRRRSSHSSSSSSSSSVSESSSNEADIAPVPETAKGPTTTETAEPSTSRSTKEHKRTKNPRKSEMNEKTEQGYSLLLSTTLDRRPSIVRREDGFEKRWLWRCGRCRLVVGYQLDVVHFLSTETGHAAVISTATGTRKDPEEEGEPSGSTAGGGGGGGVGVRQKPEGKVIYLLPGGLMSTEEMIQGKVLSEEDVVLKGGG